MFPRAKRRVRTASLDTAVLERLYLKYNDARYVVSDPVEFVHRYERALDREIVALVASSLAFGNVKQIRSSVGRVLDALGGSPADFVRAAAPRDLARALRTFKHRWITGSDMAALLGGTRAALREYGSLRELFCAGLDAKAPDVGEAAARFACALSRQSGGFRACLLPSPQSGSACKRLNLFLRWMVRSDAIDPGGWSEVPPAKLIVPLDTHMYRISRTFGFTKRRTADLKAARETTEGFRRISPEDPVKYDFALTRIGILRGRGESGYRAALSC
jgi:uncharacterized protein (TIGR02757 family)